MIRTRNKKNRRSLKIDGNIFRCLFIEQKKKLIEYFRFHFDRSIFHNVFLSMQQKDERKSDLIIQAAFSVTEDTWKIFESILVEFPKQIDTKVPNEFAEIFPVFLVDFRRFRWDSVRTICFTVSRIGSNTNFHRGKILLLLIHRIPIKRVVSNRTNRRLCPTENGNSIFCQLSPRAAPSDNVDSSVVQQTLTYESNVSWNFESLRNRFLFSNVLVSFRWIDFYRKPTSRFSC